MQLKLKQYQYCALYFKNDYINAKKSHLLVQPEKIKSKNEIELLNR